nr:hypothetical protein [uncultured Ruegeria sp.]
MTESHERVERQENKIASIKPWTAVVPTHVAEPPELRATIERDVKLPSGKVIKNAPHEFANSWTYVEAYEDEYDRPAKRTLFIRCRYNYTHTDGTIYKTYRTWYSVVFDKGGNGWAWHGLNEKLLPALPKGKWPLYGLELLAHFDAAVVWLVEGEKTADFVNHILKPKGVVAVSMSVYGAPTTYDAVASYDLTPLEGRKVIVWPDNDYKGRRVGLLLTSLNPSWRLVEYPAGMANGWDLADHDKDPLNCHPTELAAKADVNRACEPFLRVSVNEEDLPKQGDITRDGRRIIYWRDLRPELSLDDAMPYIAADEKLFNMSGRTVSIGRKPLRGAHVLGSKTKTDEPIQTIMYEPPAIVVAEEVNRAIEFGHKVLNDRDQHVWVAKNAPATVGSKIRGRMAQGLSGLMGVVDYPAIAPDHRLLHGTGYDKQSFLYVATPALNIQFGDHQVRAKQSYKWLHDNLFADVLFSEPEDRAMAVALPLTLMVKRSQDIITPGFMVNAFLQETGKTTFCNMCSNAMLGADAVAYPFGNEFEERRKQLFSIGRQGPAMVVFDNIPDNGLIDDPTHSQFITAKVVEDRLLGASEMVAVPANFVMVYNGNNLSLGTDLASRIYEIRLFSPTDKPMHRDFKLSDPIAFALDHRKEIIGHVVTMYMANQAAGADLVTKNKASRFKHWDAAVRSAIMLASEIDPVREPDKVELSPEIAALKALLEKLWEKQNVGGSALTASEVLKDAELNQLVGELYLASTGHEMGNPNARSVGVLLKKYRSRPVGELCLDLIIRGPKTLFRVVSKHGGASEIPI